MTSESKLEILLLGTPAIYYGGKPIQIKRRLLRSILFFLGYTRRMVSRTGIIMTIWPDASEEDGRRHFRESLSKLRKELPDPNIIITDQDRIGLDFSQVRVDVHEFLAIITRSKLALQQATSPVLPPNLLQDVVHAVGLWRGPIYMTGFIVPENDEYERWISDTRRELGNDKQYLMKKIASHYMASNDLIEAIRWLRNALLADEFDLEMQMQKLVALERLGQINEALEYYDQVDDLFRQEGMGELPAPFEQLHQKLVNRKKTPAASPVAVWPTALDLHIPFTGRKEILKALTASFHNGETVVIFGEAGAGKSRLLYELFQEISPNPPLLYSSGKMMESTIPLQPWIDLLRQKMSQQDWEKIDPHWIPALAQLLPELASNERMNSAKTPTVETQDRSQIFEAIHQILLYLSRLDRVFLCLDDAQWCDQTTLSSLSYLQTRGFFERHGFLVLSCRQGDTTGALDEFLKSRIRHSNTRVILLPGLDKEDLRIISRAVLGAVPSEGFIEKLYLETGGNPLFILETLHILQQKALGKSDIDKLSVFPIPPAIEELVLARFHALSEDCRQLLVTAAVIGSEINTNLIANASQLGLEKTVNALEELERAHLVVPTGSMAAGADYRFIHELVREFLEKGLTPARRKLIHKNVAESLERQFGGNDRYASTLADHFLEAGEEVKAFYYDVASGIFADRMLSPIEALSDYEKAEVLLKNHSNLIPDEYIYSLYNSLIKNYYASSSIEMVKINAEKMLRMGRVRGSALLIGSALSSIGYADSLLLNAGSGIENLTEAMPYIEQANHPVEKAKLYNRFALLYQLGLQFSKAEENFKKALEICSSAVEPDLVQVRINVNLDLALMYYLLAEPKKEEQCIDLVLHDCELIGDTQTLGKAYFVKAYCKLVNEKFDEAAVLAKNGQKIIKTQNNLQFAGYLLVANAEIFQNMGKIDAAYEQYQEVLHLIRPGEFNDVLAEAHVNYGNFFLYLFSPAKAMKIFQYGLNLQGDLVQKYTLAIGMAHALAGLGQVDAAEKILAPVLKETEQYNLMHAFLHAKICSGVIATVKGDFVRAAQDLDWSLKETEKRGFRTLWGSVDYFIGNLLLAQHQAEEAFEYAVRFDKSVAQLQNPWLEISSLRIKSKALRLMGESDPNLKVQVHVPLAHLRNGCKFSDLIPYYQQYEKIVLADFQ